MALQPGARIGPYEVLRLIGSGGMGDVYRAHDSRLGRDVALKVLSEFARDRERLDRFEREARLLASLNHPHIGAIYGLEDFGDAHALVLELIEGDTLDARIHARGVHGLPLAEALAIARQIADALEAAHDKGIVHRDLKPTNIKITPDGTVKVLDFGLAKHAIVRARLAAEGFTHASTLSAAGTRAGAILGTASYMSPEQARGQPVDRRTDIWAFGCVLYELLTGCRAFPGDTMSDAIVSVLEHAPDWTRLPPATPETVRLLLRRCLDKDPKQRLHDMADARVEVDEALGTHDGGSGSGHVSPAAAKGTVRVTRRAWLALTAALVAGLTLVAFVWLRPAKSIVPGAASYVQITNFPDSATQPALSADGRMVTFIRGSGTFFTRGQVYVKMLPSGEPFQLSNDDLQKMSPVFSADGSRIAYTTVRPGNLWDTWTVPVLGGQPRLWLPNASGLAWTEPGHILFSEIRSGRHMGLVAATESRAEARNIYLPAHERAMAHRSYLSPDRKWVLLVEMDGTGGWAPCRVVPFDGSSLGRPVGPPNAPCTSGAWSPDGRWVYVSAFTNGNFHVWRERFPRGNQERVTSGPTEEEGVAMAADGRSLITSVGFRQRTVSIHDASGDRQISAEGYAYRPTFSPDGKRLYYRVLNGGGQTPDLEKSELWVSDLESSRSERLLPGTLVTGYDIASDGLHVVFSAPDSSGTPHLWLASVDRHSPPRPIENAVGMYPSFGPPGEVFFVAPENGRNFAFRIREDGRDRRKVAAQPIDNVQGVSPDRRWLVGYSPVSDDENATMATIAYPMAGGAPVRIVNFNYFCRWSPDMTRFYIGVWSTAMDSGGAGKTYVLPVPAGSALPAIPPGGFQSEAQLAAVPGVSVINYADVSAGLADDTYAYSAGSTHRNLYRIPLP